MAGTGIEQLFIFTRGGLILWAWSETLLCDSPVESLITSVLLEDRSSEASYEPAGSGYALKWRFNNDIGLVFVAVYRRLLRLLYVDDLAAVRREFSLIYDPKRPPTFPEFAEVFNQLQLEAEARSEDLRLLSKQTDVPKEMQKPSSKNHKANKKQQKSSNDESSSSGGGNDKGKASGNKDIVIKEQQESSTHHQTSNLDAFDVNKLLQLSVKGGKKKVSDTNAGGGKRVKAATPKAVEQNKTQKKNRVWDDSPSSDARLDFTDPPMHGG